MARIRSIHPDLHRDKTLATMSANAERTFVRLWCHLDDEGRGEDDPDLLKADLYPRHRDMDADAIDRDLNELAAAGLLIRYEVDGERYLACKPETWQRYQRPQKKQESKLPGIDQATHIQDRFDVTTGPLRDQSDTATGTVSPVGEGRGEEGSRRVETLAPKSARPSKARKPRVDDHSELFSALVEVCGYTAPIPGPEGSKIGKCAKQLREIEATPDDVRARAKAYRKRWPGIDLTPTGLVSNWAQVTAKENGRGPRPVNPDACRDCGQGLQGHDDQLCTILAKAG